MRIKVAMLCLAVPLLAPVNASAAEPVSDQEWSQNTRKNIIGTNVLVPLAGAILTATASSFGLGTIGGISLPIEFERALNRNASIFAILWPSAGGSTLGGGNFGVGLGGGGGARFFFSANAPQGFWGGTEVDFTFPINGAGWNPAFRLELGYTNIFTNNVVFSLGGGLGLGTFLNPLNNNQPSVVPNAGLRVFVGYAF